MPANHATAYDVLVLGAGAAGLMCAIEAGKRGCRVALLEHGDRAGKKILISGGGRCNFTNLHCQPENFLSSNPHFARSALARYTPSDFLALIERHRIPYHEKTLGQLFCDRSSRDIVAMLEAECREAGVVLLCNSRVLEVACPGHFEVRTAGGRLQASVLVVATGGLSIPKMGATALGHEIALQFGHTLQTPRPALVPLLFTPPDRQSWCDLSGLSAEVVSSYAGASFREKMLITHRGLSGPAILQVSSYWQEGEAITIDLLPGREWTRALRARPAGRGAGAAREALRHLPQRLAERWVDLHPPADWTNRSLATMEEQIHGWRVVPSGTEGYQKAEVTAGGVNTDELSARTMESRKVRGLFFVGEVVDVTGHLGGFNFQWAWASGACAGRAV